MAEYNYLSNIRSKSNRLGMSRATFGRGEIQMS
jgi:hypothetical protein